MDGKLTPKAPRALFRELCSRTSRVTETVTSHPCTRSRTPHMHPPFPCHSGTLDAVLLLEPSQGAHNTTGALDRRLPILTSVNDWVSIDAPQNCLKSRILRLWYGDSGGMATLIDHIASSRAVCLTRLTTPGPSSLPITLPTMPVSEVPNLPKHVQSPHEPGNKAMPTWHRTPPPKLSQRVHLTELT